MEIRISRVSALVVQKVPQDKADWFLEWQRGVSAAAESFEGYRGADVYPPTGGQGDEWAVIIHFETEAALKAWLESPVRAQWVQKLQAAIGGFDLKAQSVGFGPWFHCLMPKDGATPPPSWKMVLIVLLGLYPTVMALTLFPGPFTSPLGLAASMLIGNALSVSMLQWAVMPTLNAWFSGWLTANGPQQRAASLGGAMAILGILAALTLFFRQITG